MNHGAESVRERWMRVVLVLPPVLASLALLGQSTWRAFDPAASWFSRPAAASFAEALAVDDVQTAFEFVKAGTDVNLSLAVQDSNLVGERPLRVAPLAWAVAHGSDRSVRMLIAFGADMNPLGPSTYDCLAAGLGHQEVADILRSLGTSQPTSCPVLPAGAPLAAFGSTPANVP